MPMSLPEPSKAEAKALFRLGIVGDLLARELSPGELRAELMARALERYLRLSTRDPHATPDSRDLGGTRAFTLAAGQITSAC